MTRRFRLLLVLLFAPSFVACRATPDAPRSTQIQRADAPELAARLEALFEPFEGRVGLYVARLDPDDRSTADAFAFDADATYPTASLVKVPILLALYERIEAGELDPHALLTYDAQRSRGGEDLLASFQDGAAITLSKLIHLMIAFSDNTASVWLQELAGGGAGINAWLAEHGYEHTRVNSRTAGREDDYRAFGWGQTTPREMARMLASIRRGEAVGARADEEMYRVLCRTYWDSEALSALPPWIQAASKQGAVNRSRSEVVLVNAPSGDYVFCLITADQVDTSWGADNTGFVLLRDVSRVLWEHFEGADTWSPAEGVDAWR
ncbi:serine hydrolase [Planctomycetes bacterium Pla163]